MPTGSSSTAPTANREHVASVILRWRCWPLMENRRWSWTVLIGMFAISASAAYLSSSIMAGFAALAGLAAAMWQFLLPTTYEVYPLGLRRVVLGRGRVFPWHAVRSYQLRSTGIVLYPCVDPTALDALRSLFIPYPPDEDELLCAVREFLAHAVELR